MDHAVADQPTTPLDYGQTRRLRRLRVFRAIKRLILICVPICLYVGLYLGFARRDLLFGGLYHVGYPGADRWYALSGRAASVLGQDDEPLDAFTTVRRFEDSVWRTGDRAYAPLWRAFYPLERLEIQLRGGRVVPIHYPGAPIDAATAAAARAAATNPAAQPPKLPFVGPVYHEWFVRDGRLYRFIGAEYAGRAAFFVPVVRTDVYLFEWDLTAPFIADASPRPAKVRRVDLQSHSRWDPHWLVDADHYLTWDARQRQASLLQFADERRPAKIVATLQGVGPVRCDALSPICVNRSARLFAAEKDGLCIFSTQTLAPVRKINETAALQRFFAARTDELDNKNSSCYLTDDGKHLVRIVTIYKPLNGGSDSINRTTAAIYDLDADTTRELPLDMGLRTEVKDLERVNGALQFCLQFTKGDRKWPQQLADESLHTLADITPRSSSGGLERVTWEPASGRVVDLPGHTANPQPLDLDSEIMVQDARTGQRAQGLIRYADQNGLPGLFNPGIMKLAPF
jgi:hypothetical protein